MSNDTTLIVPLLLTTKSFLLLKNHLHELWNKNKHDNSLFHICSNQSVASIAEEQKIVFSSLENMKKVFTKDFIEKFLNCYEDDQEKYFIESKLNNVLNLKS